MKKIFLLFILFVPAYMFAQMFYGEPYNFCTLSGTQYNPYDDINMWVTTDEEFSHSEIESITTGFMDAHPAFVLLDSASNIYNCQRHVEPYK